MKFAVYVKKNYVFQKFWFSKKIEKKFTYIKIQKLNLKKLTNKFTYKTFDLG